MLEHGGNRIAYAGEQLDLSRRNRTGLQCQVALGAQYFADLEEVLLCEELVRRSVFQWFR